MCRKLLQELQIEKRHYSHKHASAPLLPKFVSESAAAYHELRKRGTGGAAGEKEGLRPPSRDNPQFHYDRAAVSRAPDDLADRLRGTGRRILGLRHRRHQRRRRRLYRPPVQPALR